MHHTFACLVILLELLKKSSSLVEISSCEVAWSWVLDHAGLFKVGSRSCKMLSSCLSIFLNYFTNRGFFPLAFCFQVPSKWFNFLYALLTFVSLHKRLAAAGKNFFSSKSETFNCLIEAFFTVEFNSLQLPLLVGAPNRFKVTSLQHLRFFLRKCCSYL